MGIRTGALRLRTSALTLLTAALLGACAMPAARFDEMARGQRLRRIEVTGTHFTHAIYIKGLEAAGILHVYIEGDGSPLLYGVATPDPTPRRPLALHLLAKGPAPAILLGRPCYHRLDDQAACASSVWTDGRYGEDVLASMEAALSRVLADQPRAAIGWIGYSGGGTLAALLAPRFAESRFLVTLAANLDTHGWAASQGIALSSDTANPADGPPLPPSIRQWHFAGSADTVVPNAFTARGAGGLGGTLNLIQGYDHVCCWLDVSPALLGETIAAQGEQP
ncbi:MAG: hypothetical protein WAS73_14190 [Defluviicoccus sp.]